MVASTGLAAMVRVPANPPCPKTKSLWFQLAGRLSAKVAEPGGAKKPSVRTVPTTRQNAGLAPAAGIGVAETTVTFETWRAATASTVQAAAACARAGTTTAPTKIERAKASRDDPAIMAILLLLAAGVWARRARLQHRPTVDVC